MANLGFPQKSATPMFEDNSAAETFAKKGMGQRSLHYEVKYRSAGQRSAGCVQDRYSASDR